MNHRRAAGSAVVLRRTHVSSADPPRVPRPVDRAGCMPHPTYDAILVPGHLADLVMAGDKHRRRQLRRNRAIVPV